MSYLDIKRAGVKAQKTKSCISSTTSFMCKRVESRCRQAATRLSIISGNWKLRRGACIESCRGGVLPKLDLLA